MNKQIITEKAKVAKKTRLERYGIDRFLLGVASQLSPQALVLDAGAGNCKHKNFFPQIRYVALDISPQQKRRYGEIDIAGDIYSLSFASNTFDALINVQVLEHLNEPKNALREFIRVLKPGGRLFLTAPQGYGEHGKPYDFFRFTSFGLRYLFDQVGFDPLSIEPLGGYFWYWGHRTSHLYRYLFPSDRNIFLKILDAPVRHPTRLLLRTLIPYLCFYLDKLDKEKSFTLNYGCVCQKPL